MRDDVCDKNKVTTLQPINHSTIQLRKHAAFTLAEMLITLAIIGVVAAITIPTLIIPKQEKAWNTGAAVFERKLEEALRVMNTQETLAGYTRTEDFADELSKHLKITKICKNNDLMSCFEKSISMRKNTIELELSNISTAADFGLDWGTNLVGFQLNNGTNGILAYNPDCSQNPYSNQINGSDCIAIMYDTSGFSKPNFLSKDLRVNQYVSKINGKLVCAFEIGNTCYGAPFYPSAHVWKGCNYTGVSSNNEDTTFMSKYGITTCMSSYFGTSDYWAGAVKTCKDAGMRLPAKSELKALADDIYGTDTGDDYAGSWDETKAKSYGFKTNWFAVWSSQEHDYDATYAWRFSPGNTNWLIYNRSFGSDVSAVCIGD